MELGCRFLVHYICREMLINAYARLCPSVPVCIKIVDGGYTVPSSISCTSLLRSEATNRLGVKTSPIKFNIFYQVQFSYLKLLT